MRRQLSANRHSSDTTRRAYGNVDRRLTDGYAPSASVWVCFSMDSKMSASSLGIRLPYPGVQPILGSIDATHDRSHRRLSTDYPGGAYQVGDDRSDPWLAAVSQVRAEGRPAVRPRLRVVLWPSRDSEPSVSRTNDSPHCCRSPLTAEAPPRAESRARHLKSRLATGLDGSLVAFRSDAVYKPPSPTAREDTRSENPSTPARPPRHGETWTWTDYEQLLRGAFNGPSMQQSPPNCCAHPGP